MILKLKVAFYVKTGGSGAETLEIVFHDPRARDRIVAESSKFGARYGHAMTVTVDELLKRGAIGTRVAHLWERTCARSGAMRAFGVPPLR